MNEYQQAMLMEMDSWKIPFIEDRLMEDYWKIPFIVRKIFSRGSYRLMNIEIKEMNRSIN